MSYSTETAELLSKQLARLTTLNRHQLAGQVANLDFWISEVRHCLSTIDDYPKRFDRLKKAQTNYVSEHKTIEFYLADAEFSQTAQGPKRVPERELKDARTKLIDVTRRFLRRCADEQQISEESFHATAASLGIEI